MVVTLWSHLHELVVVSASLVAYVMLTLCFISFLTFEHSHNTLRTEVYVMYPINVHFPICTTKIWGRFPNLTLSWSFNSLFPGRESCFSSNSDSIMIVFCGTPGTRFLLLVFLYLVSTLIYLDYLSQAESTVLL